MSRMDQLRGLYSSAIADITHSAEAWRDYLEFAAVIYKYSFDNSLLIYTQRPEASMLAPLSLWNQLGRYVRKGEKSVAVCDFTSGNIPTLTYLFDISQTTGKNPPQLWNLNQVDSEELAGRLTSYDTLTLPEAISQMTHSAVLTSLDDWLQDIELDIKDHFLGMVPLQGLEQHIGDLIKDSLRYLIHQRCQLPEPDNVDFITITHFHTLPLAARLGSQINILARSLLGDIARYIKIMEAEGSLQNEQSEQPEPDVSRNRRSAVSQREHFERSQSRPAAIRQVRPDGNELSSGQSSTAFPDSFDARNPDGDDTQRRAGSAGTDGATDRAATPPSTDIKDRRYAGTGSTPEPDQIDSRRIGLERHRAETEITEPTVTSTRSEPPHSGSFLCPMLLLICLTAKLEKKCSSFCYPAEKVLNPESSTSISLWLNIIQ